VRFKGVIKITSCSSRDMWYNDLVGECYQVEELLRVGKRGWFYRLYDLNKIVYCRDCEEIL